VTLGTVATTGLLYQPPDDRWGWLWRNWWNEDWQGKPKYSGKTCPSATLSTTNSTWLDPGLKPGCRGGKPETNRLSWWAVTISGLSSRLRTAGTCGTPGILLPCCDCPARREASHARWWTSFRLQGEGGGGRVWKNSKKTVFVHCMIGWWAAETCASPHL
jgi:hypothetical protein